MVKKTMVLYLVAVAILINVATIAAADTPATAYTNHTVGGLAAWSFNTTTNKTSTDYSAWAATQTFNVGDFLIFNTNTNQTVIQTYNETTYRNCSIDDALDTDTFQYQEGSTEFGQPSIIAVPLTIEGHQYYFSDADNGLQCLHGMALEIKVDHGLGLPASLNQPHSPPYAEPPSTVEEGQSPPITIISSLPSGGMRIGVYFPWIVLKYQGGSTEFGQPSIIAVPLTIEGPRCYFSDADDGLQCLHGMAFEIKVGHGLGLPPSLNQPPSPPYVEPPSAVEEGQSPPITIVSSPPIGGMRIGVHFPWIVLMASLASYLFEDRT